MEEKSITLLPGHSTQKRPLVHVLRFLIALLIAFLLFSYFDTSASAAQVPQAPASSSLSIPLGATPGSWKTVNYGSVSIAVPASWPTYDLKSSPQRCVLFDINAVYLGHQGPDALCPARALGKSDALQLESLTTVSTIRQATTATTIAGVPAQVDPSSDVSHTFTVVLKQAGVVIHLSYGHSPELAKRILGTLHVSAKSSTTPAQTASQRQPAVTTASQASGVFQGQGFDTCTAPSTGAMSAWLSSPYRSVGIYIGGANRACGDGNLSSSWVSNVTSNGWSLIPLYVGLQAPCNTQFATIDPSQAATQGTQAADDAANLAQGFGIGTGALLINDMEGYNNSDSSCSQTVMTFLSAWTSELHARNYLSGVYSSLGSGITDLINHIGSIQEPDTIFFAHWDGVATTSDSAIPSNDWASHQRIKQYQGGHNETYGGVTINIDNDQVDSTLYGGSGNGGGGGVIPAPPGSSVVITSVPSTLWWVDTFANAPGYRGGWTQVGTLYAGTNYVYCKEWGAEISDSSGNYNHWWLWTDLDTGGSGWVSAYYLSLWGNDQAKDNNGNVIPSCPIQ